MFYLSIVQERPLLHPRDLGREEWGNMRDLLGWGGEGSCRGMQGEFGVCARMRMRMLLYRSTREAPLVSLGKG